MVWMEMLFSPICKMSQCSHWLNENICVVWVCLCYSLCTQFGSSSHTFTFYAELFHDWSWFGQMNVWFSFSIFSFESMQSFKMLLLWLNFMQNYFLSISFHFIRCVFILRFCFSVGIFKQFHWTYILFSVSSMLNQVHPRSRLFDCSVRFGLLMIVCAF